MTLQTNEELYSGVTSVVLLSDHCEVLELPVLGHITLSLTNGNLVPTQTVFLAANMHSNNVVLKCRAPGTPMCGRPQSVVRRHAWITPSLGRRGP